MKFTTAAAVAAVSSFFASAPAVAKPPISLEDMLHGADFTKAVFSPAGNRVAFSRSVPIAERPSGGFEQASVVRERVFLADRRGGTPAEIACPKDAYCALSRRRAWSPDGGRLMLLKAFEGRFNLAAWHAASGEMSVLPGRPDIELFDWAGEKVVYAALSEETRQRLSNMQMLTRLNEIWRAGWTRDAGLATVSSANPLFRASEPEAGVLMMADLAKGGAERIADGDFVAVEASPDGQYVATVRLDETRGTALTWQGRRGELQIYRMTADGTELVHKFDELDVQPETLAWNASGDMLLAGGKAADEAVGQARLYVIDARSGQRRPLVLPEDAALNDPGAGFGLSLLMAKWVGGHPAAILARRGVASSDAPQVGSYLDYGETENLRFDLHVLEDGEWHNLTAFSKASVNRFLAPEGADFALVVADGALWRVAPGSDPEHLSPREGPPIVGFALDDRYGELETAWSRSGDDERVALYTIGEAGAPQRRVLDLGTGRFGAPQPRGRVLATSPDLRSTLLRMQEDWVVRLVLKDGEKGARRLAEANTELAERAVAPVERFTYTSGGQELAGWVVTPPNAEAGRPHPAIVSVYGGVVWGGDPPSQAKPGTQQPQFSAQLLATEGYAVVYPSTPLKAGATSDVMAALARHSVAAIDALAAEGVVDPERVGVMGQSFGGYSTAAILAERSDRFDAGISMAGVYDWIHGWGVPSQAQILTPDGRDQVLGVKVVEQGQVQLKNPFWENSEAYIRNSPIFHVEEMESPLLMLHGDLDFGVTGLTGAHRMYNALVRAGKNPALVRYWGEGHVAHSEWAIRDHWSRITTWFDVYLRD